MGQLVAFVRWTDAGYEERLRQRQMANGKSAAGAFCRAQPHLLATIAKRTLRGLKHFCLLPFDFCLALDFLFLTQKIEKTGARNLRASREGGVKTHLGVVELDACARQIGVAERAEIRGEP